ncbi:hypothetical protein [Arthrobacter sp. AL12]|uniref:hypothetical protein n=1 Tax=Arthrobacter sp. AL12 TaxID=3042241 RepID=UPI00249CB169|nr:hypothetical protein [Arthrobacter sp. AL12]MDI3212299.1 hypothetical protein [Arthrobacter sp. AL12]
MTLSPGPGVPAIRAAMFVDFDNVYTGLMALEPAAAKRFAEDPKHWTDALADGGAGGESRRFLIRNCYLNPVAYSKYRTYWTPRPRRSRKPSRPRPRSVTFSSSSAPLRDRRSAHWWPTGPSPQTRP